MSTFWGSTEAVRSAWIGAEDHCELPSWGRKNILHMVLPPIYQELGLQGVFHRPMCMPGCCDTFVLIHSSLCTGGVQVGMLQLTSLPAKAMAVSADALLKAFLQRSLPRYSVKYQVKFKDMGLCFVLIFNDTGCFSHKYGLCPWQMTFLVPRQLP